MDKQAMERHVLIYNKMLTSLAAHSVQLSMENASESHGAKAHSGLPPGFRFHPTDEELVTFYLSPKVLGVNFPPTATIIGEIDLNKYEPWDLPSPDLAKMGTPERYYFSLKDKKYPNSLRTNRATDAGYWKATGKDKEVLKGTSIVGSKKTLVFYMGRAPRGDKSNWIMHEFRMCPPVLPSAKSEWVICRIYYKSPGGRSFPQSSESSTHINQTDVVAQTMMDPLEVAQYDNNQTSEVIQNAPMAATNPTPNPTQDYYPVINGGSHTDNPYEINPFIGNSQFPNAVYPDQSGTGFDVGLPCDPFMANDYLNAEYSPFGLGGCPSADYNGGASTSYGLGDIDSVWNY